MNDQGNIFKYKLDFYYQSALIYLVTMVLYGGIRGSFIEKRFELMLTDPLMYVIVFFVAMSIIVLILNMIRNRRLVIEEDAIIFRNRFHERRITVKDIEWMHIGREARVRTSGRFQVIVLKLVHRKRSFRIRVGRYEREKELLQEMHRIADHVPKKTHRRWRSRGLTDR